MCIYFRAISNLQMTNNSCLATDHNILPDLGTAAYAALRRYHTVAADLYIVCNL